MFDIKNIVNRIRDRGRESNPDSPAHGKEDAVGNKQAAEGFLCPTCMEEFPSMEALSNHYESSHDELSDNTAQQSDVRFETLHEEIGEKCKGQEGPQVLKSDYESDLDTALAVTNPVELKEKLTEALKSKSWLESEKDKLEQKAAHLAKMNAALKAASDEAESSQVTLRERLKVLEAQLAHRESIDDAAVLKQELVQVQRMMDELTREKEKERDMLQKDLQQLQDKYNLMEQRSSDTSLHMKELEDLNNQLKLKDNESNRLKSELESCKHKADAATEKMSILGAEAAGYKLELKTLQDQHKELQHSLKNKDKSFSEIIELKQKSIDDSLTQLRKMKERLEHKDKELDELKVKLKNTQEEENKLKVEVSMWKTELKERNFRMEELNSAWTKSKETSAKQESQCAELVAKIQAGEGAKTVIQQLTEKTTSLQEIIKSLEKKEEEKVKHIQELKLQLKNVTAKYQECMKELETKENELKSMENSLANMSSNVSELQVSLEGKEMQIEELSLCIERCRLNSANMESSLAELQETVETKFQEITVLKEDNESLSVHKTELKSMETQFNKVNYEVRELKRKLTESQNSLKTKEVEIIALKKVLGTKENEIQDLKVESLKAADTIKNLQRTVHANEEFIQAIGIQRTSLETDLFELQKSMAELETEKKNCEENLKTEITTLESSLQTALQDIETLKQKLEQLSLQKSKLSEEFDGLVESKKLEITKLKSECQMLSSKIETKETEKVELQRILASAERRVSELSNEIKMLNDTQAATEQAHSEKNAVLQNTLDEVAGEKLALEAQLEASQNEQKKLLEHFCATSGEMETLRHTIIELRRKWEESQAALQELGRENQTLQLDLEKLTGRKWTEDSDAAQCAQCSKDFSIMVRRHHCRNCGQIFCNECSAKLAPVGNNKKSVRVCDNCYGEIMNK